MTGILATMSGKSLEYLQKNTPSMANNLAKTLNNNGLLMQTANQQGQRLAAQRGLQNSTLGAEASQRAMISAAMPIAQMDTQNQFAAQQAGLDRSHQLTMQGNQNQFVAGQANLDRAHQRGMAQLQGDINYNNQSRLNQAQNQFAAQQAGLDRSHQMTMQGNQNQFAAQQAGLDRTHQTNMARLSSELQHNNAMKELGAQVSANTVGKSIDFAMQIANNYDAQIAGILNNTQMTADNKAKAIQQLKESRDSEIKFLGEFMNQIPTRHPAWTSFPELRVPNVMIADKK